MSESKDLLNQALSAKASRRQFIVTAAQAGAVLAAPTVIPSKALGKDGYVAPSDRILILGARDDTLTDFGRELLEKLASRA